MIFLFTSPLITKRMWSIIPFQDFKIVFCPVWKCTFIQAFLFTYKGHLAKLAAYWSLLFVGFVFWCWVARTDSIWPQMTPGVGMQKCQSVLEAELPFETSLFLSVMSAHTLNYWYQYIKKKISQAKSQAFCDTNSFISVRVFQYRHCNLQIKHWSVMPFLYWKDDNDFKFYQRLLIISSNENILLCAKCKSFSCILHQTAFTKKTEDCLLSFNSYC